MIYLFRTLPASVPALPLTLNMLALVRLGGVKLSSPCRSGIADWERSASSEGPLLNCLSSFAGPMGNE